jgi:hypothetical protein
MKTSALTEPAPGAETIEDVFRVYMDRMSIRLDELDKRFSKAEQLKSGKPEGGEE